MWLQQGDFKGIMAKHNKIHVKPAGESGSWDEKDHHGAVLLYTTNLVESPPRTTVLYQDGEICPIKSIVDVPPAEGGGDDTYVVWVRHCHSCSNRSVLPMAKMREPLCTALGSRQALDAGYYLGKLLSDFSSCCVSFYSSFLPRTFQTAKLMSASYAAKYKDSHCSFGNDVITRLCYVSEETKLYENVANWFRPEGLGSQSMTTITKSNKYAEYLDDNINAGFEIKGDDYACGSEEIAGSGIDKLACDYVKFLGTVLPTLDDGGDQCGPETPISVIVSHGGYIRHCVLQSTVRHPANTQMYLVKYTHPANREQKFPIHARIMKTLPIPGMKEFNMEEDQPAHAQELYDAAIKANTRCNYTYHKNIAPTSTAPPASPAAMRSLW
tara:strand:+ start:1346 stop:2494 length:1149 start_codon:yes stop_codon:yes gene_type:complete